MPQRAVQQQDAADEAGASHGASLLILVLGYYDHSMLTYRARQRVIKFDPGVKIATPGQACITFELAPGQAFGTQADGGRTAVRSVTASVSVNRRTGQYTIESAAPLSPLELKFHDERLSVSVAGDKLTVNTVVASERDLQNVIELVFHALPLALAVDFADPPIVTDVYGTVNGLAFGWNLVLLKSSFDTTTQDQQEQRLRRAWNRMRQLADGDNRRLLAALHYFHVATRLERQATLPGEFLSEALLNYAKILQVLFSESTDQIKVQLRGLGFADEVIERDFIPAVILRSKIDVAHVSLAVLSAEQLHVLQWYADRAERQFRTLLARVLDRFDAGTLELPPYEIHEADSETTAIIDRMGATMLALGDRP